MNRALVEGAQGGNMKGDLCPNTVKLQINTMKDERDKTYHNKISKYICSPRKR
jgi:hypothetical protein